jgi:hypothetical protein
MTFNAAYRSRYAQIFDVPMTKVETIVEPDSVANGLHRELVTFISIHHRMYGLWAVKLSVPITYFIY